MAVSLSSSPSRSSSSWHILHNRRVEEEEDDMFSFDGNFLGFFPDLLQGYPSSCIPVPALKRKPQETDVLVNHRSF